MVKLVQRSAWEVLCIHSFYIICITDIYPQTRGYLASQLQQILQKREKAKDIKLRLHPRGKKYSGSVSEPDGFGSHITAHPAGYFLKQSEMLLYRISSSRQTVSCFLSIRYCFLLQQGDGFLPSSKTPDLITPVFCRIQKNTFTHFRYLFLLY